jgi:hypothetical protein
MAGRQNLLGGCNRIFGSVRYEKLAKEDPARRLRFIRSIRTGGDLVISVSNAAELTGPTGDSAKPIKEFLSELGAHGFPVEMDAKMVSER